MKLMRILWVLSLFQLVYSQSESVIKCGFFEQIRTGQFKTSLYKASSFQYQYISPSGHFIIYYNTIGDSAVPGDDFNQNGIPDRVEIAGAYGDKIWALLIDSLGFHPPYDYSGNYINQYPIYFIRFGYALYGQTVFDSDDIPSVPGYNMVSHMELNTDFSFATHLGNDPFTRDSLAIAVTVSHEFFHAVQLGYHVRFGSGGIDDDLWWIEASATAFEEWNVPDGNDYWNYIPSLYRYLHYPIYQSVGQRIYGEVVIPLVIGSRWGKEFMRIIWEDIINQSAVYTIENYLENQGSSWREILADVALWCMQAGRNLNNYEYPDLPAWPRLEDVIGIVELDPDNDNIFTVGAGDYNIRLMKLGILQFPRYLLRKQTSVNSTNMLWSATGDLYRFSENTIVFQSPMDSIFYFVQTTDNNFSVDSVEYSVQPYLINSQSESQFFPNPFYLNTQNFLVIQNVTGLKRIELYSLAGRRVYEREINFSGDYVIIPSKEFTSLSSGIYMLKITADKNIVGKLMIIK